jgi:hypothetical protein
MFQDLLVQVQSLKSYFRLFQGVHLFLLIKPVVGSSFLGKHSVLSWISCISIIESFPFPGVCVATYKCVYRRAIGSDMCRCDAWFALAGFNSCN